VPRTLGNMRAVLTILRWSTWAVCLLLCAGAAAESAAPSAESAPAASDPGPDVPSGNSVAPEEEAGGEAADATPPAEPEAQSDAPPAADEGAAESPAADDSAAVGEAAAHPAQPEHEASGAETPADAAPGAATVDADQLVPPPSEPSPPPPVAAPPPPPVVSAPPARGPFGLSGRATRTLGWVTFAVSAAAGIGLTTAGVLACSGQEASCLQGQPLIWSGTVVGLSGIPIGLTWIVRGGQLTVETAASTARPGPL